MSQSDYFRRDTILEWLTQIYMSDSKYADHAKETVRLLDKIDDLELESGTTLEEIESLDSIRSRYGFESISDLNEWLESLYGEYQREYAVSEHSAFFEYVDVLLEEHSDLKNMALEIGLENLAQIKTLFGER